MPDPRAPVDRFILLYALAWAGGTIAYTPLLTILLPVRVAELVGEQVGVDWLATIALAGAVAASFGGVAFGYLSDISRNRRGWILAGLVLSCVLLIAIGQARSLAALTTAIVAWQLALNMMLGPLAALAGDLVPDDHKGVLGGLMAFAPGMGALSSAVVTQPGLAVDEQRLWLVAAMVAGCVLPVLLVRLPTGGSRQEPAPSGESGPSPRRKGNVLPMWFARLAVQVAEATLFAYLYFWLAGLDPGISDNYAARLFSIVMLVSAPLALAAGRWSDRHDRPIAPLKIGAAIAGVGLLGMAIAPGLWGAVLGYGLFGLASAIFLALHSAQTLRILPRADRRARDLGLFNLANTVPSLVMPWLVLAIVPTFGFAALFLLLAALCGGSSLLLSLIEAER